MTFAESSRTPAAKSSSPCASGLASPAAAFSSAFSNAFEANIAPLSGVLARMLDEIDYGLVLVTASGRMRYANQLALRMLVGGAGLQLVGGMVTAGHASEQAGLRSALADAARGLRRMLNLGGIDSATGERKAAVSTIAVVPMAAGDAAAHASANSVSMGNDTLTDAEPLVMLVFGKQPASETLTLDFFARTHRLTGAESGVLHGLCAGHRPKEIAQSLGVAISTVRTQIGSIRIKTQTRSIRDLINRIATLPPITPAMKSLACH